MRRSWGNAPPLRGAWLLLLVDLGLGCLALTKLRGQHRSKLRPGQLARLFLGLLSVYVAVCWSGSGQCYFRGGGSGQRCLAVRVGAPFANSALTDCSGDSVVVFRSTHGPSNIKVQ